MTNFGVVFLQMQKRNIKVMDKCLLIFTRKPELGKVKTRLAKDIGDQNALDVYKHLLTHSFNSSKDVNADKHVWYTNEILHDDIWCSNIFNKHLQPNGDLGYKMKSAFQSAFESGYKNVVIIGSDLLDIDQELIDNAFRLLGFYDVVLGPAKDGGYYLLGLNEIMNPIFKNKSWGTEDVFNETMADVKAKNLAILEYKNDIDHVKDLEQHPELLKFIN